MIAVVRLIDTLITVYIWIIIARAVVSWFGLDERHPVVAFLDRLTEPVVAPIRRFIGVQGPVDFSPLIAIALFWLLRAAVSRVLLGLG